jgi:hypothetical protein
MSAEQFRDLCHEVGDKRANLDSCHDSEAPTVAARLLQLVVELRSATLRRASRDLELLRDRTIDAALLAHARRGYSEAAP